MTGTNIDNLPRLPGFEKSEEEREEHRQEHPLVTRMNRLIATLSNDKSCNIGPANSLDKDGFLYFVGAFYAPQYYYGQRMRRAAGRGCVSDVLDLLMRGIDCNCGDGEGAYDVCFVFDLFCHSLSA